MITANSDDKDYLIALASLFPEWDSGEDAFAYSGV